MTPNYTVFVGHGFLQQARAGRKGHHELTYHMHMIPEGTTLEDSAALA